MNAYQCRAIRVVALLVIAAPLAIAVQPTVVHADDDDRVCTVVGATGGDGGVETDGYCDNQAIVQLSRHAKLGRFLRDHKLTQLDAIRGRRLYLVEFPKTDQDEAVVRRLARDRRTAWAELNAVDQAPETRPRNFYFSSDAGPQPGTLDDAYAPSLIGVEQANGCSTGRNVTVAVIDTGLDKSHAAVQGRVLEDLGWNVIDGSSDYDDKTDGKDNDGDRKTDEAHGHGTHVAGIVAQTAPRADLLPIKALDDDGTGNAFDLTQAIYLAGDRDADVINLSVSTTRDARAVREAVNALVAQGIVVAAAAGNQGVSSPIDYPASIPDVLSVAATDREDAPTEFSNFNDAVDLAAPGDDVVSAFPGNNQYRIWSGTSMATPWVAGAAALLLEDNPGWTPEQVGQRLRATAVEIQGSPAAFGAGRLDVGAAVACPS